MSNWNDYLAWRGDLTFDQCPLQPVDALLMASVSYLHFGDNARGEGCYLRDAALAVQPLPDANASQQRWYELLQTMAKTRRFSMVVAHHYEMETVPEEQKQFSAITFRLPNDEEIVCFRGTDNSMVGWREDFLMSAQSPVPAQLSAVHYLNARARSTPGRVYVAGHSKGGNLAMYAAIHSTRDTVDKLTAIYNFDGPGLNEQSLKSEHYHLVSPLIHSFVPQDSVVGMLMHVQPSLTAVHSTHIGIWQHDAFSWEILGSDFVTLPAVHASSLALGNSVRAFLDSQDTEHRLLLVNTLFDLLEASGSTTLRAPSGERIRQAQAAIAALGDLDAETRKTFWAMVKNFASLMAGETADMIRSTLPESLRDLEGGIREIFGITNE